MKKYALFIIGLLASVVILILYVNISFSRLQTAPFYDGCYKVWGHRGYFKNYEMNSLEGFQQAFDMGARGVELDVHYDTERNRFVVAHDLPEESFGTDVLQLEEVFAKLGERGFFWLDIKNLGGMRASLVKNVADLMLDLLTRYSLKEKVIVESKVSQKLAAFSKRGIFTSYWITPGRNNGFLAARLKLFRFKVGFLRGGFSAVSMNYLNFTPDIQKKFANVSVHLFTINGQDHISEYLNMSNVKIILSDDNFYTLNTCGE